MKNFVRNQCRKLSQSRTGAAVLMVLLVSVFVVLMGSSVLFTSQNGYLIKLVDRMGLESFYSTESLLDQMRAEVQDFSSTALKDSYTKVMSEYAYIVSTEASEDDIQAAAQAKFSEYFLEELDSYFVDSEADELKDRVNNTETGTEIFEFMTVTDFNTMVSSNNITLSDALYTTAVDVNNTMTVGGKYNPAALGDLLGFPDGVEISAYNPVDDAGNGYFTLEHGVAGDRMVIQDVTIAFVEDGYLTYITTDIIIEMPDFVYSGDTNYGNTSAVYEGVPFSNTASIGKYWVKYSSAMYGDGLVVRGDMYGGVFFIYNENSRSSEDIVFSHSGGRLITSQVPIEKNSTTQLDVLSDDYGNYDSGTTKSSLTGFEVYDGTTFSTEEDSEIWTSSINVHEGSDLSLAGFLDNHDGNYYVVTIYDELGNKLEEVDVPFGGVNVQGDLRVYGGDGSNESNVRIAGDYFGFGSGTTSASASAILIDNTGVNLSLAYEFDRYLRNSDSSYQRYTAAEALERQRLGFTDVEEGDIKTYYVESGYDAGSKDAAEYVKIALQSLKIAGTGYLTVGSTDIEGNEYQLGQSISTLPDQLAYLIPIRALNDARFTSNPAVWTGEFPEVEVITTTVLWGDKTIGDYATNKAHVITNATVAGYTLAYCFYDFISLDHANAYFKDYMTYNESAFQSNYSVFVNTVEVEDFLTVEEIIQEMIEDDLIKTQGNFYAETNDDGIMIASGYGSSTAMDVTVEARVQAFKNAAVTLNPEIPIASDYTTAASKQNPYDYYVDEALFEADSKEMGVGISYGQEVMGFYDSSDNLRGVFSANGTSWLGKQDTPAHFLSAYLPAGANCTYEYVNVMVDKTGINLQARSDERPNYETDAAYAGWTAKQIAEAEENRITYEGVVMAGVGVAVICPLNSNPAGVIDTLDAETEYFFFDDSLYTGSTALQGYQKCIEYDSGFTVTATAADINAKTGSNLPLQVENSLGLWVTNEITYTGLEAYTYVFYNTLKTKYWNEQDEAIDAYFDTFTGKPNQYMPEATYLTVKVPMRAYFDHLVFSMGSSGSEEHTPGEVEKGLVINWGANDLVYFENWEKY